MDDGLEEVDARGADERGDEDVLRQGVDLARRADLLEPSAAHHGDPVAEGHRLGLIMRHIDGGDAQLPGELRDFGPQMVAQLRVEVGERLVHQEHRGPARDGPAHGDALALTTGELTRVTVEDALDAEHPGRVLDASGVVLAGVLQLQREADVGPVGHGRVEREVLEHHGHAALAGRYVVGRFAVEQQLALGDLLQAGDHAEHGRLAAPRGAEQDDELARVDGEREAVDGTLGPSVRLADVVQGDGASHVWVRPGGW